MALRAGHGFEVDMREPGVAVITFDEPERLNGMNHHLKRDLGLVLARCGLSRPASIWLDRYLKSNPDDPQKSQLKELLQVLSH